MSEREFKIIYIGVTGLAGSGKDAFCDLLMDNVGSTIAPHRVAFADPLKRTVSEMYGVPLNYFYDRDKKEAPIKNYGMDENGAIVTTPRLLLQKFGTDVVRKMDTDHWVKRIDKEVYRVIDKWHSYNMFGGGNNRSLKLNYTLKHLNKDQDKSIGFDSLNLVIIPDVRFDNEQRFVKDNGGFLINVTRPEKDLDVGKMDKTHASETSINKLIKPDFEIDNDQTLTHLELKAIATLNKLGLR